MNNQVVLDTIPDKDCKAFLEHPEETVDEIQQCTSSDNIPTGPDIINKMQLDEDVRTFDKAGQQAIPCLFGHLQDTHNHMSQVAAAVVELSKVSFPEQFTFVLKLVVRPIIQLKIPPHFSAPTDLKFEKERLTQEETIEEYCSNLILPQPFHPKLSDIPFKHPTRCLAAAAHFLIRKKLFNSKYPQPQITKDFAVAEKKLHLTASVRKYDPGKKPPPPIKGLHQVTSQLQQKLPHKKKNSSTPKVTSLLKLQKLPRCQDLRMMMMKLLWTLLHHQKHFPQKIQSPSQRNHGSESSCASTYKYSINILILSIMFNSLKVIIVCYICE